MYFVVGYVLLTEWLPLLFIVIQTIRLVDTSDKWVLECMCKRRNKTYFTRLLVSLQDIVTM